MAQFIIFWGITMVWNWYAASRNQSLNFDLSMSYRHVVQFSPEMQDSGAQTQLLVSPWSQGETADALQCTQLLSCDVLYVRCVHCIFNLQGCQSTVGLSGCDPHCKSRDTCTLSFSFEHFTSKWVGKGKETQEKIRHVLQCAAYGRHSGM
jgi:hypothetical protein